MALATILRVMRSNNYWSLSGSSQVVKMMLQLMNNFDRNQLESKRRCI